MRVEWRPVWSTVYVDDGRRGYIELAYNCLQPPLLGPRPRFSHARSSSPIIFTATAPTAAADAAACKTKQNKLSANCVKVHTATHNTWWCQPWTVCDVAIIPNAISRWATTGRKVSSSWSWSRIGRGQIKTIKSFPLTWFIYFSLIFPPVVLNE